MTVELVHWFSWDRLPSQPLLPEKVRRIYIGSETCEHLLPPLEKALGYCQQQIEFGRHLTIVTPLISNDALKRVLALLDCLSRIHDQLEIVCNDWGLVHVSKGRLACRKIAGRLLGMQKTDPRFALFSDFAYQKALEREIPHMEGFNVRLKYQPPSPALLDHLRQCPLDSPEALDLLKTMEVDRFEISNLLQGISLRPSDGWRISLHAPEVMIAVARHCNRFSPSCMDDPGPGCSNSVTRTECDGFPVPLYSCGNAWFYCNPNIPENLSELGIDRIVYRVNRSLT